MLIHGENDNDVPIAEAEQFYIKLKDVGVEAVMLRYPREGHGLREPVHVVDSIDRSIDWTAFGIWLTMLLHARGSEILRLKGLLDTGGDGPLLVDCVQHGYRPLIPREAVGDRNAAAHEANLYDMDAKYGDVVTLAETLEYLEALSAAHAR